MTTEEIIQRLLDEKKITVKEALVILKDVITNEFLKKSYEEKISKEDDKNFDKRPSFPYPPITVMYGVTTNPYTYESGEVDSTCAISNT